jgi:hypothetical protein
MSFSLVEKYQSFEGIGIHNLRDISLHMDTTLLPWRCMKLIGSKRRHLSTRLLKLPRDPRDSSHYTLSLWRGQNVDPKRHFPSTRQHGVKVKEITVWIITAMKISSMGLPISAVYLSNPSPLSCIASWTTPCRPQTSARKQNLDPTKKHCLKYSAFSHPNYPLWWRSHLS